MSMCGVVSCVVRKCCLLWPVCSLDKTLLAFDLLHFVLQDQTCLLHLRSMLCKQMRCTKNCIAWSGYQSTERAQFFPMTVSNHILHNQCFISWMNWTAKFFLICHIQLTSCQLTIASSISTTFCRENASTPSGCRKMLSKSSLNPKHEFLHCRNKQTFLIDKNVLIVMVPILIAKDAWT